MAEKKSRIWELDVLRGICIIGMVIVHLFFDLRVFAGFDLNLPMWFVFIRSYGHVLFVLISGICVTLASRSFKRGLVVFGAGLLISYVTLFMDVFLKADGFRIWFGILHMLGVCMMLYPLFKKLPWWLLAVLGLGFVLLGFWLEGITVSADYLFLLGLCSGKVYVGSDFFPIFPGLGWFLLGAALGKTLYRKKESLLPKVPSDFWLLKALGFVGRNSLLIYLFHQPVLTGLVLLFTL